MTPNTRTLKGQSYCSQRWANPAWPKGSKSRGFSSMEQKHKSNRMNKGGRPKKGAADKLKYRLTVKMATSDYYTLKGKVRSAGISAGEFLRRCMRDGQVKERLTPEHTGYVRQLCGMANNLNQLAHKANTAGFVTVRMECRILVARIEELLNFILL